jgi:HEAT repeat protein
VDETADVINPMLTFFCPNCWNRIAEDADQCPHCGYALSAAASLSYEERLVLALRHSVTEYRVTAARILGQRGAAIALPEFRRIIETERDYYLLRAVLYALLNIDSPQSAELLTAATRHPSRLVSRLAHQLADRMTSDASVRQGDQGDAVPGGIPHR